MCTARPITPMKSISARTAIIKVSFCFLFLYSILWSSYGIHYSTFWLFVINKIFFLRLFSIEAAAKRRRESPAPRRPVMHGTLSKAVSMPCACGKSGPGSLTQSSCVYPVKVYFPNLSFLILDIIPHIPAILCDQMGVDNFGGTAGKPF